VTNDDKNYRTVKGASQIKPNKLVNDS